MTNNKKFRGIIVPAVTPLTATFHIDEAGVEKLFALLYEHNVSPFILGTTGEAPSLPRQLKENYIRLAAKNKKPGSVLYAGISSTIVQESIELAQFCAEHAVDAVAITLPAYYTLSETQMMQYFESIADASPIPIILYNIPATTHSSIPLHLIDTLSHHPNIIATKDSERNEERLTQSLQLWKDRSDFGHFLGWAAKSADALMGGSDGIIPSTGNLVPNIYATMLDAVHAGNSALAYLMQTLSDRYGNVYQSGKTLGESLWALKALMQKQDICQPFVMPPLTSLNDDDAAAMYTSFLEIRSDEKP